MIKQAYTHFPSHVGASLRLAAGHALRLGPGGGALQVLEGRVWFTRGGSTDDTGDHRLESGQQVWLAAGQDAVIEPWDAGHAVRVEWLPRPQGVVAKASALVLQAVAVLATQAAAGLRGVAGSLAALGQDAAAQARRARSGIADLAV